MKPYSKYEDVLEALRQHVNRRRRTGNYLLEGERELIARLGTSRKTLAKALGTLAEEGDVYRDERKATCITPQKPQKYTYAYVPYFHRDTGNFWYSSDTRMWNYLQFLCSENMLKVDPVPFDPEYPGENVEQLAEKLSHYSAVFLSLFNMERDFPELIRRMEHTGTELILLDESNRPLLPGAPLISLDHYGLGKTAAEVLLAYGYRRPLIVGTSVSSSSAAIFNRVKGFTDEMEKQGISCRELFYPYRQRLQGIIEISEYLAHIREKGVDCLFFPLDYYIELITIPLYEQGLVPDTVGIITTNSDDAAPRHTPTIAYLTTGDLETAEEILNIIRKKESGKWVYKSLSVRLKSCLISGKSLRKDHDR